MPIVLRRVGAMHRAAPLCYLQAAGGTLSSFVSSSSPLSVAIREVAGSSRSMCDGAAQALEQAQGTQNNEDDYAIKGKTPCPICFSPCLLRPLRPIMA